MSTQLVNAQEEVSIKPLTHVSNGTNYVFHSSHIYFQNEDPVLFLSGNILNIADAPIHAAISIEGQKLRSAYAQKVDHGIEFHTSLPITKVSFVSSYQVDLLIKLTLESGDSVLDSISLPFESLPIIERDEASQNKNQIQKIVHNVDLSDEAINELQNLVYERYTIEENAYSKEISLADSLKNTLNRDITVDDILDELHKRREVSLKNIQKASPSKLNLWAPPIKYIPHTHTSTPQKVALITYELYGPSRENGTSKFFLHLAEALREGGHKVTVLLVPHEEEHHITSGDFDLWKSMFEKQGISLELLKKTNIMLEGHLNVQRSYEAFQWLRTRDFDCAYFNAQDGLGFYSTVAKSQNLALGATTLCVRAASSTQLTVAKNTETLFTQQQLEKRYLEKISCEKSDVLFGHNESVFDWLHQNGYHFDTSPLILPQIESGKSRTSTALDDNVISVCINPKNLQELRSLLDGLEKVNKYKNIRVRLYTSEGEYNLDSISFINKLIEKTHFNCSLNYNTPPSSVIDQIVQDRTRAIVLPSDLNAPYILQELDSLGVPVLITPGVLTDKTYLGENIFQGSYETLDQDIHELLQKETTTTQAARENHTNTWLSFQSELNASKYKKHPPELRSDNEPLVSVCIPTRLRRTLLIQAIESVDKQSYRNIEIVICDDGSDEATVQASQLAIADRFPHLQIRFLRQRNMGPGAARNHAAAESYGEYLFFLDDDNLLKPDCLNTLVRIAQEHDHDAITASLSLFQGEDYPKEAFAQMLFLGPCVSGGYLRNVYGDTFGLISRKTFLEIGGFDVNREASHEDWEIYARMTLLKKNVSNCPLTLGWYRSSLSGHFHKANGYYSQLQNLTPFKAAAPKAYSGAIDYIQNLQNLFIWRTWFCVPIMIADQDHLERKYLYSDVPLLKSSHNLSEVTPLMNCTLSYQDRSIKIDATTIDPQVRLPEIKIERPFKLIAKVDITVPCDTHVQIFYLDGREHFYSENRTSTAKANKGRSTIYLPYQSDSIIGPIRFDPGFSIGEYILHSFEFREINF